MTNLRANLGYYRDDILLFNNKIIKFNIAIAILVTFLVSIVWFSASWRYGFDPADEGYFWYGSQRILHGELPMRDFMAYDIGRYFWGAAFMNMMGDSGIFAARLACFAFQFMSNSVGVILCLWATPAKKSIGFRVVVALTVALILTFWTTPYFKTFDHGASIMIVAMIALLLKSVTVRSWFMGGVILGTMAMVGRNHGIYGATAAFFALCFLLNNTSERKLLIRPAALFVFGVVLSFSPTFFIMYWAPGFSEGFVETVRELFRNKATNIALPIPWPWVVDLKQLGWINWALAVSQGTAFILLIVVPAIALASMFKRLMADRTSAHVFLLAATMTGIPYAHYAYSRADMAHLALAIFPLLLALFAVGILIRAQLLTSIGVLLLSIWVLSDSHPLLAKYIWRQDFYQIQVSGQSIFVNHGTAEIVAQASAALARHPEAVNNFLAQPNLPGIHAMQEVKIPIWEIYSLFARDQEYERLAMAPLIASAPRLIFLSNHALDNREEFRYSRMHPLIYAWVQKNYMLEQSPAINENSTSKLDIYVLKK